MNKKQKKKCKNIIKRYDNFITLVYSIQGHALRGGGGL